MNELESTVYSHLESIVVNKITTLEEENEELKRKLAISEAKLEVYERIVHTSNSKATIGFATNE